MFVVATISAAVAFGITRGLALEMPAVFGPVYADLPHNGRLSFT